MKIVIMDEAKGAICGDGMCPYVPCAKFPDCEHVKSLTLNVDNYNFRNYRDGRRVKHKAII